MVRGRIKGEVYTATVGKVQKDQRSAKTSKLPNYLVLML